MDLLSYRVIGLLLEPYRNAVAKSNNAKSIELPVQQEPDNDEFDQPIDFELPLPREISIDSYKSLK